MVDREFTDIELSWYKRYEKVRAGGKWNMFDHRARFATKLESHQYTFVMDNFSALRKQYELA